MPSYRRRTYPQTKQQKRDLFPYFFFFFLLLLYIELVWRRMIKNQTLLQPLYPTIEKRRETGQNKEERGAKTEQTENGQTTNWCAGAVAEERDSRNYFSKFHVFFLFHSKRQWRNGGTKEGDKILKISWIIIKIQIKWGWHHRIRFIFYIFSIAVGGDIFSLWRNACIGVCEG